MIERYEQLSYFIYSIYRSIQRIAKEEMEKHNLRGAYAHYLVALCRHSEGVTSAKLCEICDKDKAATSRFVAEMEEKGLICREGESFNMYRAKLILTPKGKAIADVLLKRVNVAVELAGRGLSDENRAVLYSSLGIIESNLKELCKIGLPE